MTEEDRASFLAPREPETCRMCGEHLADFRVEDHTFPYGEGEHAPRLTCRIPVWTCRDADCETFTAYGSEDIETDAINRYKGSLRSH